MMYTDQGYLDKIVYNLVSNAVKYTKEGEVTFSMKDAGRDGEWIFLDISVADTGIGIKPEDLNKLGSAFMRLEEGKNRNIEGAGLGRLIAGATVVLGGVADKQCLSLQSRP